MALSTDFKALALSGALITASGAADAATSIETIVDNNNTELTTQTGTWTPTTVGDEYGSDSYYASGSENVFRWNFPFSGTSQYSTHVFARFVANTNRDPNAEYVVHHTGGDAHLPVAQNDASLSGQWVDLGTYVMDGASSVSLAGGNSGTVASADALKFVMVPAAETLPSEFIVDNDDVTNATPSGPWKTSTMSSGYGPNYLYCDDSGCLMQWKYPGNVAGDFNVSTQFAPGTNRTTNAHFIVHHEGQSTDVSVDQTNAGLQDVWFNLGHYTLQPGDYVEMNVSMSNSNGYSIADAVRFQNSSGGTTPTAGERYVVDNADTEQVEVTGDWTPGSLKGGWNDGYVSSDNASSKFCFKSPYQEKGEYLLESWWVSAANRDGIARYTINYAGGQSHVDVDQSNASTSSQWNTLGIFTMDKGSSVCISPDGLGTNSNSIADAVSFTPVMPTNQSGETTVFINIQACDTDGACSNFSPLHAYTANASAKNSVLFGWTDPSTNANFDSVLDPKTACLGNPSVLPSELGTLKNPDAIASYTINVYEAGGQVLSTTALNKKDIPDEDCKKTGHINAICGNDEVQCSTMLEFDAP